MMSTDADSIEDTKSTTRLVDVTDDSCTFQYIEIVPLTRDPDGPCDSGDWSAQVKQENLTVVKQEPQDDDGIIASCCSTNDAEHDKADETQTHMQPANVHEELNVTRVQQEYSATDSAESCSNDTRVKSHRRRQTGERLYSCTQCGKSFLSRGGLCNHMNTHTGRYTCTECGKCCHDKHTLAVHERAHSGEKPFECSICSKRFAKAGHLFRHDKLHRGEKPYKCHLCDKVFSVSANLKTHMRVHTGEKPYMCLLCDKSFSDSSNLQSHNRHVHSDRRAHLCPYCGMLFKAKINLKCHVRTHTGAKPYSCRHCSERFTRHGKLKRHLFKSHNEGTWLTCHICQKKFCDSDSLKIHVRRHEGVKPYVCSECPKCFCTTAELRKHQSVHLDSKQFWCSLCDASFAHKDAVKKHFRKCSATV